MSANIELLQRLFRYEADTGLFYWNVDRCGGANEGWVKAKQNDQAGKVDSSTGYVRLRSGKHKWFAHRAAWMLTYGKEPQNHIDHINGIKTDNRLENLRDVDRSTNLQNRKRASAKNKSTGVLGVSLLKGKFIAGIRANGKSKYLGTYQSVDEASAAYLTAKRILHPGNTL